MNNMNNNNTSHQTNNNKTRLCSGGGGITDEPKSSIEKLNWLIHLEHIRGETVRCKELIQSEIAKSNGRNEFAFFKQVSQIYVHMYST